MNVQFDIKRIHMLKDIIIHLRTSGKVESILEDYNRYFQDVSIVGMCQVFLGHVFIPGFSALYFCTLFTGYRAVACYPRFLRHVLQTKNLTKKSRKKLSEAFS